MKLTQSSKILMDFFTNNKCINNSTQNKRTTEVLIVLYNNIIESSCIKFNMSIMQIL